MSASREEREQQRLRYIRESIRRIQTYTRGGRAEFLFEEMVQDAVLRRLETLADACHRLPENIKGRHPHIPWGRNYAFSNKAAHDYEGINLEVTWQIIEQDLPPLKQVIAAKITPRPRNPGTNH